MIKLLEERVVLATDHARARQAAAEDLAFRAQRVGSAIKNGSPVRDRMFGDDLQLFRKGLVVFAPELLELPNVVSRLDREARPDAEALRAMQGLLRAVNILQKEMRGLQAGAFLAHQHIRNTTYKVESIYIGLELERMTQKTDLLPQACGIIILKVGGGPALEPPAAAPKAGPGQSAPGS